MKDFITWRDSYSVGIQSIDDQHKVLVGLVNDLLKELDKEITDDFLKKLTEELENYSFYHFSHEEKFMKKYAYSGFKEHKEEHDLFIEKVKLYKTKSSTKDRSSIIDFATFLKDWLLTHIMGTDRKYMELFLEKRMD